MKTFTTLFVAILVASTYSISAGPNYGQRQMEMPEGAPGLDQPPRSEAEWMLQNVQRSRQACNEYECDGGWCQENCGGCSDCEMVMEDYHMQCPDDSQCSGQCRGRCMGCAFCHADVDSMERRVQRDLDHPRHGPRPGEPEELFFIRNDRVHQCGYDCRDGWCEDNCEACFECDVDENSGEMNCPEGVTCSRRCGYECQHCVMCNARFDQMVDEYHRRQEMTPEAREAEDRQRERQRVFEERVRRAEERMRHTNNVREEEEYEQMIREQTSQGMRQESCRWRGCSDECEQCLAGPCADCEVLGDQYGGRGGELNCGADSQCPEDCQQECGDCGHCQVERERNAVRALDPCSWECEMGNDCYARCEACQHCNEDGCPPECPSECFDDCGECMNCHKGHQERQMRASDPCFDDCKQGLCYNDRAQPQDCVSCNECHLDNMALQDPCFGQCEDGWCYEYCSGCGPDHDGPCADQCQSRCMECHQCNEQNHQEQHDQPQEHCQAHELASGRWVLCEGDSDCNHPNNDCMEGLMCANNGVCMRQQ